MPFAYNGGTTQVLLAVTLGIHASFPAMAQIAAESAGSSGDNVLHLLSANLEQDSGPSDPVLLYSVMPSNQLSDPVTVLPAQRPGSLDHSPTGIYSIHETDPYIVIEYPHLSPRHTVFLSKAHPGNFESINFDPEAFVTDNLGHVLTEPKSGLVCDLWPLKSVPAILNEKGYVSAGKMMLRSACKAATGPPFLRSDAWSDYVNLRWDGDTRYREVNLLSSQDSNLIGRFVGAPDVVLKDMPPGVSVRPRSSPRNNPKDCFTDYGSSICPNGAGVTLEAANASYIVVSVRDEKGQDHNADVFALSMSDGKWTRLKIPALSATDEDKCYYRLFGNWLVTSTSGTLRAANHITEGAVSEILTVIEPGEQSAVYGIKNEVQSVPNLTSLPTRHITLWNLADARRIDLDLPEEDSEIIKIFSNRNALLRIHDKLFSAGLQNSELVGFKLVAADPAVLQMHWAFYSDQ